MMHMSMSVRWLVLATGLLLVGREAFFYVGFYILGSSIGWPASLGLPAEEIFLLIQNEGSAMFTGYYVYMLSSALFIPIAFCLRGLLQEERGSIKLLADIAVGFAILSAGFRVLGILRWLFAMPVLSAAYLEPGASEAVRDVAVMNYYMMDGYAGKIGEHLGLGVTGFAFLIFLGVTCLTSAQIPKILGLWLVVSGLLFVPLPDIMGFDGGVLLFVNGITYSASAGAVGLYLILVARRSSAA